MTSPSTGVTGKSVLVTGGGSGLGAASAVMSLPRQACASLSETAAGMRGELWRAHRAARRRDRPAFPVGDPCDRASRIPSVRRLDVLINCAGTDVTGRGRDYLAGGFDRVIHANLCGPAVMARAALPHQKRRTAMSSTSPRLRRCAPGRMRAPITRENRSSGFFRGFATELRRIWDLVTAIYRRRHADTVHPRSLPGDPLDLLQDPHNVARRDPLRAGHAA